MSDYGNMINPYGKDYMVQGPQRKKTPQYCYPLMPYVTEKTTEESYRRDIRNFFYYHFNVKKPIAEDFKDKAGKTYEINEQLKKITEKKDSERYGVFKSLDEEHKKLNCVVMGLEKQLETLGSARRASSITRGPVSPLPESTTINSELDKIERDIKEATQKRTIVINKLNESRRKIKIYNAGINECELIKSELEVYDGQMKPNS